LRIEEKIPTRPFLPCLFLGICLLFLLAFSDPFPVRSRATASEDDPASKTGRSTTKKSAFNLGAALHIATGREQVSQLSLLLFLQFAGL